MASLFSLKFWRKRNEKLLLIFFITFFFHKSFATTPCCDRGDYISAHPGKNFYLADPNAVSPNDFTGSDLEKIMSAINVAKNKGGVVVIPRWNATRKANIWKVDSAILLPANMTLLLDNCVIQLSDSSRDNLFRSDNIKMGAVASKWNDNITIIGLGNPVLKGADNPRSTGDGHKVLVTENRFGHFSYGTDAGKPGRKQTGDWRNIMILMAYVNNFKIKNVTIENSHAFAISFERVINADISEITFKSSLEQIINGRKVMIVNRDGIDLRRGCKNFRINNLSGYTQDDFIALSNFAFNTGEAGYKTGNLENTTLVTSPEWHGAGDDIEDVYINNISCQSLTRAVAIRSADSARIQRVYINNVTARVRANSVLVGGTGYGKPSLPGRINNIYIMNLMGDGHELILVESPIENCVFMNSIYTGEQSSIINYNIERNKVINVKEINLVRATPNK